MSRTLIAIQARLSSSRMPRKVLADLSGKPMIAQMSRRLRAAREADGVVIACPIQDVKAIEQACPGIPVYGGPEQDLLTRLIGCADEYEADMLVRVTGDCPLVCPEMIDYGIKTLRGKKKDDVPVCQNWRPRTYPDGFDFDVWRVDFLEKLSDSLRELKDREYFAQYCLDKDLNNSSIQNHKDLSHYRLTVDWPEDLELIRLIYTDMGDEVWGAELIIRWLVNHPKEAQINQKRIDGTFGEKPK